MKKKLLLILVICSFLVFAGCNDDVKNKVSDSEDLVNQAKESFGDFVLDENSDDVVEVHDYSNVGVVEEASSKNKMLECRGGVDPSYLIYLTDEEAYQKVSVALGEGYTEMSVVKYVSCARAMPSEVPPQCAEVSSVDYKDMYLVIKTFTEKPVSTMMGISCEEVNYDAGVFILGGN